MKFTPLDIQRREFERGFRGLDENEVRSFLHDVAAEWEEIVHENQKFRDEVLDLRERMKQYQDQDRIFRETLLQAQRTREDLIDVATREKTLMLKEAEFKADEILRAAQEQVAELEAHVRSLKMDRLRLLQDIDSLLARTKRFLQEEAPELFPPADVTRKMTDFELTGLDEMPPLPSVYRRPMGTE